MSKLSAHHKTLTEGEGKCSKPMWDGCGMPAGFCDRAAFGKQEANQTRSGEYVRGEWFSSYVPYLACYEHGGPLDPQQEKP